MEGDITFSDDIIKEMSIDYGIEYKEMKEIIYNNIDYIKNLGNDPEVTRIKLGSNLGYMTANFIMMISERKRNRNSKFKAYKDHAMNVLDKRIKKLERLFEGMENAYKDTIYNKMPFLFMLKKTMHRITGKKTFIIRNSHMLWQQLSEYQNKITNEMNSTK